MSCGTPCIDAVKKMDVNLSREAYDLCYDKVKAGIGSEGEILLFNFLRESDDVLELIEDPNYPRYKAIMVRSSKNKTFEIPVFLTEDKPEGPKYLHIHRICESELHLEFKLDKTIKKCTVSKYYHVAPNLAAKTGVTCLYPVAFVGDVVVHVVLFGLLLVSGC